MTLDPRPSTPLAPSRISEPAAGEAPAPAPAPRTLEVMLESVDAHTWSIRVVGELDGHAHEALAGAVDTLLATGATDVLLDLSGVSLITSRGVAACVVMAGRVHDRRGTVALLRPAPPVRAFLEVLGVHAMLPILEDQDEALAYLAHARQVIRPPQDRRGPERGDGGPQPR